jgi:hypothetical protein
VVPNEKLVFVDIETGGLEHTRPIIQMAAVAAHASLSDRPGEFELVDVQGFEAKVLFDEKQATRESLRKNSYDRELWLEEGLEPKTAAYGFAKFLREHATIDMLAQGGGSYRVAQLVAHNAAFDGPFLHAWYQRLGIFCPASYRVMCTMQRAMWLIHERKHMTPPADYKLGTLCEYFGVRLRPEEAHNALFDVRATLELYKAITAEQRAMRAPRLRFEGNFD